MNIIRLLPVFLSFILLAAHFSRAGSVPFMVISLMIPLLLLVKRAWVVRTIQLLLLAGAVEWVRTMFGYIEQRKAIGDDWTRLAIILVAVALFTALSGLIFSVKPLRKRYNM